MIYIYNIERAKTGPKRPEKARKRPEKGPRGLNRYLKERLLRQLK
jgi:hypothetical protein